MQETADTTCPVCRAAPGDQCTALDFKRLPTVHLERDVSVPTPLYDVARFTVALDRALTESYMQASR